MLERSTTIAMAGGGRIPLAPLHKVLFWDDSQMRISGELDLHEQVRSIKLRKDLILVGLLSKIQVFRLDDFSSVWFTSTCFNEKGLCCMSVDPYPLVVSCPASQPGRLLVYYQEKTRTFDGHTSPLACLAMTPEGNYLASASAKGTLIRVFDCKRGTFMHELRRGIDQATVYSLAFHNRGTWLACISDRGTLHIFGLGQNSLKNKTSAIRVLSRFLPRYFNRVWSFAHYKLTDGKAYCAFYEQSVFVFSDKGVFYELSFDTVSGGECNLVSKYNIC